MTKISRKKFLEISALASTSILIPKFLAGTGNHITTGNKKNGRKLIVIQLSGGNDGLNTFIPYGDDLYYKYRPLMGYKPEEIIKIDEHMGLNPVMKPFEKLLKDGDACIINQVGYPNPDRSHFRSMDIWTTGSDANQYFETGWLGRYLDHYCNNCNSSHVAMEVDDVLSLALKGEHIKGLAIKNPQRIFQATRDPFFREITRVIDPGQHEQLSYLAKTMIETSDSAEYIYNHSKIFKSKNAYPDFQVGERMRTVAELICSGSETQIYYISITGFDTHVRQKPTQERLLNLLSESLASMVADLKANDLFDSTLIMAFSEFGRRVEENASLGTDHGAGNNLILIGGGLRKHGFWNEPPDMNNLTAGDLTYKVDFRKIYSTILEKWLNTDPTPVMGTHFDSLNFI